ncbi:MAG: dATP pyrophosphohydrolase [Roseobacter sp.]|jgi:di/tricarboxylate transporter|uniref:Di-and tricarboxylate transporter n=2 Tax=Sulfitobacter TaxID=60136 RepID=A0A1H2WQ26_9RHOB|nr:MULTISPECIES: SLC13 family permease [Sulfitobacter]MAN09769.1 dATP pyrophosphohydrolase [Roseobacter sp.]NKX47497.1 SLC13 family permease [Rhodobacteraceae bacterium R_SAG8]AXI50618.1 dATP pyrophosphohydrolase [Sulfitobacter sp. SK025]EAP79521.1 trkA domain protein [Sulfitobacter sp. NAS-14.1]KAJ31964.1 dATP pyrophosphohydrolase [Sulfitobacter pontiacus 3SOLIMAR09]|tara:strand:- start:2161 stop:3933 length:1773 start_codon:yes stop_codon:yes gene_type:complete
MDFLNLSDSTSAILALTVVVIMFVMFLRESLPTEVVALSGAAIMLALGILPYDDAQAVLQNSAPWTIAAMFIVMGALVRTGALDVLTRMAERYAKTHPKTAVVGVIVAVMAASAVMNNTPVVVVMIPVVVQLSQTLGTKASKLLIPLSYAAIMGGSLTLIGTSTNLLVDGVARSQGLEPFGIFEILPIGLVVCAWGLIYMAVFAPKLLPARDSMANMLSDRSKMKFFTEAVIPPDSNLIGREVLDVQLFKREGVRLIDVVRGDQSLRRDLASVELRVGDRVVLRTQMTELLSLQANKELKRVDQVSAVETSTVEVLITPGCKMVGRTLGALRLRRRYGVYPLAVHRRNQNIGRQLDDLIVKVGDTLLLEGAMEDIQRLASDMDMVDVSQPSARAFRRGHAPIAIAALVGIVVLAALNVAPILLLAVLAVALVLVTGCIDAEEAFSFVDGRLLALIFSMLAVGAGLQNSGAISLIVDNIAPFLGTLSPFYVIFAVFLLTTTLTEIVSNNAVAVIMTPIAISLGSALGMDPRPLVVAVMIAASCAFATPIGYQTNTLVYGPGGYRFTDFMRIGIPLNLSMSLLVSMMIPLFW